MGTIEERVNAGIRLLDATRPGWHREIKIGEQFSMASAACCILGQLYGSYDKGHAALSLNGDAHEYGFVIGLGEARDNWGRLRVEWVKRITERSAA